MTDITLFVAPGSCARVSAIALEETGAPYKAQLVRFMKGEHKAPAYRAINPKGKIPALLIDGQTLTENVAIISYLNVLYPSAKLMPPTASAYEASTQLADLCFCATTLHPIVTRLRIPTMFASPDAARSVWELGHRAMQEYFDLIEKRLLHQPWWYSMQWSAMDAYLYWVFWRVTGAGFDASPYPSLVDHARRMELRDSVKRALEIEATATRQLEAEGLVFTPPPPPQ